MKKNQSDPPDKTALLRWGILLCTSLVLAGCITGTTVAADTDRTAVLVFTDWHAHTGQTEAMVQAVNDEAEKAARVIVCFNGDSENIQTKDDYHKTVINTIGQWNKNHAYVTPFMELVDKLLENPKVTVIMGIGNHELGFNYKNAKSSQNLSDYISALQAHLGEKFNSRFYVVSTELQWKAGGDMAKLYGTTVQRSIGVHNITFLSVVSPDVMSEEMKKYKKGNLYERIRITYTLTGKVSEITKQLKKDASCVLLAHSGYQQIQPLLQYMSLPENTYLFTGHNHHSPSIKYPTEIRAGIQPDKYGKGVSVLYAAPDGTWTGIVENLPLLQKSNDAGNSIPIEITGYDDLLLIRDMAGTYTVTADIDLPGDWTPVGTADDPFTGVFDGGGHTIRGLNISTPGVAGFFGYTSGAVMKNLNITVKNITGSGGIGGVAGFSQNSTIENVSVLISGVVTAYNPDNSWYDIGGIAGVSQESTIQNISVLISGRLTGPVEEPWEGEDSSSEVGGVVGFNNGGIVLNASVVITGAVTSAANQIGGLAGCNNGFIITSSATGNVSGTYQTGGLAGSNSGVIADVYFTGRVTSGDSDGESLTGGLVGFNEGVIRNAYAAGTVDATGTGAGGLVGGVFDDDPDPESIHIFSTIENSASLGESVNGTEPETGGFVGSGYRYDEEDTEIWGLITDCYTQSAITVNGEPVSESIRTGRLTAFPDFWNNKEFYTDWSFSEDWQMNTHPLFLLPVLHWQSLPVAGDLSYLIPRHTIIVEVNDSTRGVLIPDTGTKSELTAETYRLEVLEGTNVTFRITPVFGNTTTRLTADASDLKPVSTTYQFTEVAGDHTLSAEFGPAKTGEPTSPRQVPVDLPQETKDMGIENAVILFDGDDDIPDSVEISVQTAVPAENYGPVPEGRNTKLILQLNSSTQPQNSSANVSVSVDRTIVPNPDRVTIYHNVLTDAVKNIWTQQPVANLTYRVEADVVVFSFLTPTFSYFTVTEAATPVSDGDSDTAANVISTGRYVQYPRAVVNGGLVTFGASPIVTSIEMPAGYSGQVVLTMKPGPDTTETPTVYTEFTVTAAGYPAGNESLLNIRVPLADLALQGYSTADIRIYRLENDTRTSLPVTHSGEENTGYAYVQAQTPAMGSFAVVFETKEVQPAGSSSPTATVTSAPARRSPTQTQTATDTSAPDPTQGSLTVFSCLAGLGAGIILRQKQK